MYICRNEQCVGQSLYRKVKYTFVNVVLFTYTLRFSIFYKFMLSDCVSHTHLKLSILSFRVCIKTNRHFSNFDEHLE